MLWLKKNILPKSSGWGKSLMARPLRKYTFFGGFPYKSIRLIWVKWKGEGGGGVLTNSLTNKKNFLGPHYDIYNNSKRNLQRQNFLLTPIPKISILHTTISRCYPWRILRLPCCCDGNNHSLLMYESSFLQSTL